MDEAAGSGYPISSAQGRREAATDGAGRGQALGTSPFQATPAVPQGQVPGLWSMEGTGGEEGLHRLGQRGHRGIPTLLEGRFTLGVCVRATPSPTDRSCPWLPLALTLSVSRWEDRRVSSVRMRVSQPLSSLKGGSPNCEHLFPDFSSGTWTFRGSLLGVRTSQVSFWWGCQQALTRDLLSRAPTDRIPSCISQVKSQLYEDGLG